MTRWFSYCAAIGLQLSVAAGVAGCTGVLSGFDEGGVPLGVDGQPLPPYINAQGEIVEGVFVREDGVLVDRNGVPVQIDPATGEPILDEDGNPIADPSAPGVPGSGIGENWVPKAFEDHTPVSPARRLTKYQYEVSVSQAFGMSVMLPELPADETATLEHAPEASPLGDYETYAGAATELGRQIAPALVDRCNFVSDAVGCTQSEIAPALRTLYRREVEAVEVTAVSSVISEAIARSGDAAHGVTFGIARALSEPSFLYRVEEGSDEIDSEGGVVLTATELASRLSFFASDEPPHGELLDLAASGSLSDPIPLEASVESAFAGDNLKHTVWAFMSKMLGLPTGAIETDPLRLAMTEETRRFVEYILVDEQAPLSDLFNANYSFINAELAAHYGVAAPATDWAKVEFPESSRRRGILTHASFLSAHGREEVDRSWIFRGKAVFENLFCGELQAPPEGVVDTEPKGSRTEDPSCRGCHLSMDPTGQFFDNFDREGALISTTEIPGSFRAGSDIDLPFADLPDFLNAVSDSRAFRHCFVKHWFGEALGRPLTQNDASSFETALQTLEDTGSLRTMLNALALTPSFQNVFPKPADQVCQ